MALRIGDIAYKGLPSQPQTLLACRASPQVVVAAHDEPASLVAERAERDEAHMVCVTGPQGEVMGVVSPDLFASRVSRLMNVSPEGFKASVKILEEQAAMAEIGAAIIDEIVASHETEWCCPIGHTSIDGPYCLEHDEVCFPCWG